MKLAPSILLDNQGSLIVKTASGGGGNINLHLSDRLTLRHNRLISADAGGAGSRLGDASRKRYQESGFKDLWHE